MKGGGLDGGWVGGGRVAGLTFAKGAGVRCLTASRQSVRHVIRLQSSACVQSARTKRSADPGRDEDLQHLANTLTAKTDQSHQPRNKQTKTPVNNPTDKQTSKDAGRQTNRQTN